LRRCFVAGADVQKRIDFYEIHDRAGLHALAAAVLAALQFGGLTNRRIGSTLLTSQRTASDAITATRTARPSPFAFTYAERSKRPSITRPTIVLRVNASALL
jgi:hypothetical protein